MTDIQIMQEFFKSELKTLDIKTGLPQAEAIYKTADTEQEAIAKINEVTLLWATCSCNSPFDRITPDVKKRIIQDQMIKDESFIKPSYGQLPGFNNRIIWKWLNHHWALHGTRIENKITQPEPEDICPPEKVDEYIKKWKQSIDGFQVRPEFTNLNQEIEKIKREDKERQEGRKSIPHKSSEEYYLHRQRMDTAARNRNLHKATLAELNKFEIEGEVIIARTKQEAEEMYLEVYEG